ncbi:Response regulator receiver domain-containing protein [Ekhidna lutea]|uniref:Response regulator receiver domain-containing protein n=1 Tax=Ekhidna lutea TaxID=447679 RepID=A0A239GMY8_EKHLU|nr:response regulator [Ekhidna lutea]SNS70537.1 Response regulator receiver domain-containing protein [Ekhidna lutea]
MKILVVDDERDVQPLFEQRFRREIKSQEFELKFVLSGEEAIEYLQNSGFHDKLILSDINMPGMSGLELLDKIQKSSTPPPPVVMMISAYGDEDNINTAKKLGANDFLTKPLDFNMLREKIKSLSA